MGHTLQQGGGQGVDEVIVYNAKEDMLEGGLDRRQADGGVSGK
jgi:gamma-glutamyltranspeptidase / glutathione hydrolase